MNYVFGVLISEDRNIREWRDMSMGKVRFCFVILHYIDLEMTQKCVKSIQDKLTDGDYAIVVVDNASPDGSGEILSELYREQERVHVILKKENDGFAKGNNAGYQYARESLGAEIIICMNNDTMMIQDDFLRRIHEIEKETKCAILGPKLISGEGIGQGPRREKRLGKSEVKRQILRKEIVLMYFYFAKYVMRLPVVERCLFRSSERYQCTSEKTSGTRQENIVLVGACIVFCTRFVKNEKYAFSPKTFMYVEEDLLAWYCYKKNYKVIYEPSVEIMHIGEAATKKSTVTEDDNRIFRYRHIINGLKLLEKEMRNGNEFPE